MQKTIVCTIEEEVIMNYLFIKELYQEGDKVLLITQYRLNHLAEQYRQLFQYINDIEVISLEKDGDEDFWDTICKTIRNNVMLRGNENYYVNLSSGTRIMSIAVQQVFESFNSKFFFMPLDRNVIIHSQIDDNNDNNDDMLSQINHKVTVAEYMKINGVSSRQSKPTLPAEYAEQFFGFFTGNHLTNNDFDILEDLRDLRDKDIDVSSIKGLDKFLRFINFPQENENQLTMHEIQYLTGGWFEEYIYYLVKETIAPDDIAMSVRIQRQGSEFQNELDVVFTLKNRLYAIECKTGVGKRSLYNQIVYKACALKEALLGIRSYSYIFSLNEDHKHSLERTARNMGIFFCDREFAEDKERFKKLLRL